MKGSIFCAMLVIPSIALSCARTPIPAPENGAAPVTAFIGVTVVPADRERIIENQTVIVQGDRIATIAAADKIEVPPPARRIDGRGKFLMPGLAEMHGHLPDEYADDPVASLKLFIANGVTTVRGMLGAPDQLELRKRIDAGELLGPRLFVYSPAMNGNMAPTPEVGVRLVDEFKRAGYDGIKIHEGLALPTFEAIAHRAKELDLPFGGHVPNDVGLERALSAGQRTVEHLDGFVEALEPAENQSARATSDHGTPSSDAIAVGVGSKVSMDRVDESKIPRLVAATKQAGAKVVPTLQIWQTLFGDADARSLRQLPELAYAFPLDVEEWTHELDKKDTRASTAAQRAKLTAVRNRILKACADAGGLILLGSDAPQAFNVPGFSLRHEVRALAQAGMTPWQIVEAGTVAPARFLGLADDFGTVEVGKRADLLLIDGNPLTDILNVFRASGVMIRGRWLARRDLDDLLAEVARLVRTPPSDPPLSAEESAAIVGTYELAPVKVTLVVEVENGVPMLTARDPKRVTRYRLRAKGKGVYVLRELRATLTFHLEGSRASSLIFQQAGAELQGARVDR